MNGAGFFIVGVGGAVLSPRERTLFARHPPAGIIFFSRNIESEPQFAALLAETREALPETLLFIDQEGGPVDRFRALTGGSASFSRAAASGEARRAGALAGELCARFGIDVDLAPVVDRAVAGAGRRVLQERAASEDPREVSREAARFLEGLSSFGVAGCLKHFPGLGRGTVDSHLSLPRISREDPEWRKDLLPFRDLAAKAPAVMISHAATSDAGLPASLDRAIASGLLREDVGFDGVAISDDLEMGALSAFGSLAERSAAAFVAGCDLLCIGKETEALPDAAGEVESRVGESRVAEARERLERFRQQVRKLKKGKRAVRPLSEIAAEMSLLRDRA